MSNKPTKIFKLAIKYGFRGMLVSFTWLLFSMAILCGFKQDSIFRENIYRINKLLLDATDILLKSCSIPADCFPAGYFIILVLYLTTGFLLGFIFYFVCQIFRKSKAESDMLSRGKNEWRS